MEKPVPALSPILRICACNFWPGTGVGESIYCWRTEQIRLGLQWEKAHLHCILLANARLCFKIFTGKVCAHINSPFENAGLIWGYISIFIVVLILQPTFFRFFFVLHFLISLCHIMSYSSFPKSSALFLTISPRRPTRNNPKYPVNIKRQRKNMLMIIGGCAF